MVPTSDKSALRAHLRARRRALADADPGAAARAAVLLPIGRLPALACVASYWPTGSEMDPAAVVRRLTAAGAALALPAAAELDAPLVFRAWMEDDRLEKDAAGVPSPLRSAAAVRPNLVIAPLLAFDRKGGRLGQGGGHYDRTLENLRRLGPVFVLGLAYAGQEVDDIPMEPHDQRLDAILTEIGYSEVG